jgi:hypothetical protein
MEREKLFKMVSAVLVLAALGCFQARAELVELPLDCAGTYDIDNPYWIGDFDLGVTFTEIFHVYIDWAGEITGGLAIDPHAPDDPFPVDAGLLAVIGKPLIWRHTEVWGGETTYPNPEPFATQSEFQEGTMPWSKLFHGQGTITIEYTELIIPGSYIEHGSVFLTGATLVVDGTVVPEPAMLLFLAVGACGLARSFGGGKVR